MGHFGFVTVDQ